MSVGLEDAIDFQLFLLKSNGWTGDNKKHSRVIKPGKDLVAYLKQVVDFGRVCVEAGQDGGPVFNRVEDRGNYLRIHLGEDCHLAVVPEQLEINVSPYPKSSYIALINNPFAVLPKEEFDNEAYGPILFYVIDDSESKTPRCFYDSVNHRLEKLEAALKKSYPLSRVERSNFFDDRHARYSLRLDACNREGRRCDMIKKWLDEFIPFTCVLSPPKSAGNQVTYIIDMVFPRTVSLPKET